MHVRKFLSVRKVFIMKKLMTLALAAGMLLGAATGANAIDFKAKGQWIMSFDYGQHADFRSNQDGRPGSGYKGSPPVTVPW